MWSERRRHKDAGAPGCTQCFLRILPFCVLFGICTKGQVLKLSSLSSKYGTQLTLHLTKPKIALTEFSGASREACPPLFSQGDSRTVSWSCCSQRPISKVTEAVASSSHSLPKCLYQVAASSSLQMTRNMNSIHTQGRNRPIIPRVCGNELLLALRLSTHLRVCEWLWGTRKEWNWGMV